MTKNDSSSTHPPLLSTTEDDRISHLRLLRSRRVGPVTYARLLAEHGSAAAALDALPHIARDAGVSDYEVCPIGVVHGELKAARAAKARLVFKGEPDFPRSLANINVAPVMLWMIGVALVLQRPMVALFGARNALSLGTRMAHKQAQELGEAGFTVVSGLARGVDAAAHDGSFSTGTVAVVAGGVDVIYPAENANLAQRITKNGLRISDQPIELHPHARHFVARNPIISSMAQATIVVEAAAKSGSLITARTALDQGRDVLAVPGHPFHARALGCNMLIRDGAILVRSARDILDHPGDPKITTPKLPFESAPQPRSLRKTALLHSDILDHLSPVPMAKDQLIRSLGAAPTAITPLLMDLELDGKVIRQAGGILARAN
jgi:DNA processing protein